MKKWVSILLVCTLLMTTGFAIQSTVVNEGSTQFCINEYDVYIELKAAPEQDLSAQGFSLDEINSIKENSVENELYRRSLLSDADLAALKYTPEQIAILRNYDGSDLEDNPQMRAAAANFVGIVSNAGANTSSITAQLKWTWSNAPAMMGPLVSESLGVTWDGTDANSNAMQLKMDQSASYNDVTYVPTSASAGSPHTDNNKFTVQNIHGFAQNVFKIHYQAYNQECWAESGVARIKLVPEATGNSIYSASFVFGYAHMVTNAGVSVGVGIGPISAGISFPLGSYKMFHQGVTINYLGYKDIYYDYN